MVLLIFEDDLCAFLIFLSAFETIVLCNERFRTLAAGIPRTPLSSSSLFLPTTSTASSAESIIWPNRSSDSEKLQ